MTVAWKTGAFVALVAAPWYGLSLQAQENTMPPPPGELIDIGGRQLHLDCRGEGTPTVVIDTGVGAWSVHFTHVQGRLVDEGLRTCTYDRAGLGWSDPAPSPRTSAEMADDLHALLRHAGERPPYVLLGHSLGGLNVRLFAARFPDEVAGVVLAEAAHEAQWERLPPEAWAVVEGTKSRLGMAAASARAGKVSPASISTTAFEQAGSDVADLYVAAMLTPKPYEGFVAELNGVPESHRIVGVEATSLNETPLAVVTAGNSFAAFAGAGIPLAEGNRVWLELQRELLSLSTNSRQFVSDDATHHIQRTDPGILVEAVHWVVRQADSRRAMGSTSRSPRANQAEGERCVC